MSDIISFGLGIYNNKETNDFLRCLWSRLEGMFGKLAWAYSPLRVGNTIFVGQASIGENITLDVRLHYKKLGCLSYIEFIPHSEVDITKLKDKLKQCVIEASQHEKYLQECLVEGRLDENMKFCRREGESFWIDGNVVGLKVFGYSKNDSFTLFKAQLAQICDLLTFDTLKYIAPKGSFIEDVRKIHNLKTVIIDSQTGEKWDEAERNDMYKNLHVSDGMANYINVYLNRRYGYEEHYSNYDISLQLFAQGVKNEDLSEMVAGLQEPYAELAIVNYMSALEIITLNDKVPTRCEYCGQMIYSIARRVYDLAEQTSEGFGKFVRNYYRDRSKYVHTGALLSSNSYIGKSIPMMSISKNSRTGMITQVSQVPSEIKELVKACIEWHEVNS